MIKYFTCIECPMGCRLTVEGEGETVFGVTGNSCPRGKIYAESEFVSPRRVITTTVRSAEGRMIPVKTDGAVPKDSVLALMKAISACRPALPVRAGEVLLPNLCDGVNLIATKDVTE